jgi:VanZ family protein
MLNVMHRMKHVLGRTIAGRICLCVLAITLTAGLWPFHAPANHVRWLQVANGLEFGGHGSAVSSGVFRVRDRTDTSGTLEIWVEPASSASKSTILSFDGSAHPGEPFSLHQKGDAVAIRRNNVDPQGVSRTALFFAPRVFQEKKPVFVTVVLNSQQTSVYLNGVLAKVFPHSMTWNDLTGRLVLANSPSSNDSWPGRILGLAMYPRELTAAQIDADYASWMALGKSVQAAEGGASALYLFAERGGLVAHNNLDPATDLEIPRHYFVLHPGFMVAPRREYHPTWSYWQDVGANIAGFAPFGFCVFAYLSLMRVIKHPGATTVLLGLLTSLTIELMQAFLPTRSSGMTDLITNTLGTAIGVMICRCSIAQMLLAKANGTMNETNCSDTLELGVKEQSFRASQLHNF